MKKPIALIVISVVLITVLHLGNKFWPGQWWVTILFALIAGVIGGLSKRLWDRKFLG